MTVEDRAGSNCVYKHFEQRGEENAYGTRTVSVLFNKSNCGLSVYILTKQMDQSTLHFSTKTFNFVIFSDSGAFWPHVTPLKTGTWPRLKYSGGLISDITLNKGLLIRFISDQGFLGFLLSCLLLLHTRWVEFAMKNKLIQ